ncbi:MAG: sigma-70 family RNA polymerase sigma factor [Acidobacteriota bacterium]|nr:MAG: sigma-70 family RNA polymerase sigma factor [Acidobacteriota bacterium]
MVKKFGPRLYRLARRFAATHEEADEILQETFLRAHTHRRELRDPDRLLAWLRRIAANTALNFIRKEKRLRLVSLDDAPPSAAASTAPDSVHADSGKVRALVSRLPPRQREALLLWLDEMTYGDIAEAMDCSVGAAKAHVHAAVGSLRKMLRVEPP